MVELVKLLQNERNSDLIWMFFIITVAEEAEQKFDATYCDLQTLLKQSDFIVLLTPLTDETYHLIGEKEFSLMKETAIFINASAENSR